MNFISMEGSSSEEVLSDVFVIEVSAYCKQEETQHGQPQPPTPDALARWTTLGVKGLLCVNSSSQSI